MKSSYLNFDQFTKEECPRFMNSTEIEYAPGVNPIEGKYMWADGPVDGTMIDKRAAEFVKRVPEFKFRKKHHISREVYNAKYKNRISVFAVYKPRTEEWRNMKKAVSKLKHVKKTIDIVNSCMLMTRQFKKETP